MLKNKSNNGVNEWICRNFTPLLVFFFNEKIKRESGGNPELFPQL
jgi:hypothetical protein